MIRAAIVGLGRWGQTLVESVQDKSEKIRFVRGVSRDPGRTREFGDKKHLALTNNFQAVLDDPDVDAVVLATPHSQHFREIVAAAKAGKHVFVEKPMTLSGQDAAGAVSACQQAGVALGIGFGRRLAPAFLEMQQVIAQGTHRRASCTLKPIFPDRPAISSARTLGARPKRNRPRAR